MAEQKLRIEDREASSSAQSGNSANDKSARCIARCGWLEGIKRTAKVTTSAAFQLREEGGSWSKWNRGQKLNDLQADADKNKKTFPLIVEDFHKPHVDLGVDWYDWNQK